jgi:hypothetical protein
LLLLGPVSAIAADHRPAVVSGISMLYIYPVLNPFVRE